MDGDQYARLAYLVLLGLAVGGWFLAENRHSLGKVARQAIVWGLLFVGLIAAFGLWDDIRTQIAPRQSRLENGSIEVPRAPDGHFYLTLELDGTPVRFLVDTGASDIVLSWRDARRIGLDPESMAYPGRASTANGTVRTAYARIGSISLGGIRDEGLQVAINAGEMSDSLLGMSYLRRFRHIELKGNRLVLTR